MTPRDPESVDDRIVAALREHFAPHPPTAALRAAVLAAAERRRGDTVGVRWMPLAGAGALAAAALALLVARGPASESPAPARGVPADGWEITLLDPTGALPGELPSGTLPDDYELLLRVASAMRGQHAGGS